MFSITCKSFLTVQWGDVITFPDTSKRYQLQISSLKCFLLSSQKQLYYLYIQKYVDIICMPKLVYWLFQSIFAYNLVPQYLVQLEDKGHLVSRRLQMKERNVSSGTQPHLSSKSPPLWHSQMLWTQGFLSSEFCHSESQMQPEQFSLS